MAGPPLLTAPVLSTPDTLILDHPTSATSTSLTAPAARLSDDALRSRYEISRTAYEILVHQGLIPEDDDPEIDDLAREFITRF